jgi:hypothetical protein
MLLLMHRFNQNQYRETFLSLLLFSSTFCLMSMKLSLQQLIAILYYTLRLCQSSLFISAPLCGCVHWIYLWRLCTFIKREKKEWMLWRGVPVWFPTSKLDIIKESRESWMNARVLAALYLLKQADCMVILISCAGTICTATLSASLTV